MIDCFKIFYKNTKQMGRFRIYVLEKKKEKMLVLFFPPVKLRSIYSVLNVLEVQEHTIHKSRNR